MPERNCVGCTKQVLWGCSAIRIKDHPPNEPDQPSNWLNPAKQPVHVLGETLYCCPRQSLHENPEYWSWLLKFYGFYKKGHLPQMGGLIDQSNKAIEMFRVLDDANDQCDRTEAENAARKNAKGRQPPAATQKRSR